MPPFLWNDSFVTAPCLLTSKQFLVVTGLKSPSEGRLKLDLLALCSFRGRYVHAVTFHPSICSFLIKQEEKGRSERNGIACLTLKIETDRDTGWKENVSTWVTSASCSGVSAAEMGMRIKAFLLLSSCLLLFPFHIYTNMVSSSFGFHPRAPPSFPICCQLHLFRV